MVRTFRGSHSRACAIAISVVPQDISLFHRSVMENISLWPPDASDDEVCSAAIAAKCDQFIAALSEASTPSSVSGASSCRRSAQRNRDRAGGFLKDAPILLLDEATSALDIDRGSDSRGAPPPDARTDRHCDCTSALIDFAQSDRIVVLREGRIEQDGFPDQIAP